MLRARECATPVVRSVYPLWALAVALAVLGVFLVLVVPAVVVGPRVFPVGGPGVAETAHRDLQVAGAAHRDLQVAAVVVPGDLPAAEFPVVVGAVPERRLVSVAAEQVKGVLSEQDPAGPETAGVGPAPAPAT